MQNYVTLTLYTQEQDTIFLLFVYQQKYRSVFVVYLKNKYVKEGLQTVSVNFVRVLYTLTAVPVWMEDSMVNCYWGKMSVSDKGAFIQAI